MGPRDPDADEELATLEGLDDELRHRVQPNLGGLAETPEHTRARFDRHQICAALGPEVEI